MRKTHQGLRGHFNDNNWTWEDYKLIDKNELTFRSVRLQGWRQFKSIEIDLSSDLTVLTGPNGCGKTTILNILARHFGWNINLTATPYIGKRLKKRLWTDIWDRYQLREDETETSELIGSIEYSNGSTCELYMPSNISARYQLKYQGQIGINGISIPSHRPAMGCFPVQNIPVDPKSSSQSYEEYRQILTQAFGTARVQNPGLVLKQSIMSLAVFGAGNEHVQPNPEFKYMFDRFQDILKNVLPKSLGFQKLEIRNPEIVLVTSTGDFPLDSMSGGISELFTLAWQIHMYGADKESCTIVIDEPENHLHPSMQRSILRDLRTAFEGYKFIVATHSPFVAASDPEAKVYALPYEQAAEPNQKVRVISNFLERADLAGPASDVLRDILDVPTTLPIWAETELDRISSVFASTAFTSDDISTLKEDLGKAGLSDLLPEAVALTVRKKRHD